MTWVNYILIEGEKVPMQGMDQEKKKEIANQLNRSALSAVGYKEKEDTA